MQANTTKKYKLLDYRITIKYVEKDECDGNWTYGHCDWAGNDVAITISTKNKAGKLFTEDELESTVRHELFHVILGALYFTEVGKNETLVEWLSQATKILHKQGLNI